MTNYPPPPQDPNKSVRTAGTIALWMWILIAGIPIALIVGCVLLCGVCGLGGAFLPDPDPSAT